MAILAGLIFAWVFKVVLLAPKEKPAPPAMRTLTVAAFNLRDKIQIYPHQVKTVSISEEEYQRIKNAPENRGRTMLEGNQPIYRTTTKSIMAEKPIFNDELEPFEFTQALSTRVKAGMRAVNLRLDSEHCEGGLIRTKDKVDVLCTMSNENLPGGSTATAIIAKGVDVIARNDTTETYDAVNQYAGLGVGDSLKSYTVQTTPFRASLIDLARKLDAQFTLVLSPDTSSAEETTAAKEPDPSVVTTAHLAELFGIRPPEPGRPDWLVEHVVGVKRVGYQDFPATSQRPTTNGTGTQKKTNGSGSGDTSSKAAPRNGTQRPMWSTQVRQSSNQLYPSAQAALSSTGSVASNDFGFRPKPKGCPTCGGKKKR
jgi:Flp pilus assembly protein CpaB